MGIFVGLLNAFTVGFLEVFLKKLSGVNPNFLTWVRAASAAPILAILVTVFSHWAIPPLPYWIIVIFLAVPLEILLAYLGTKAVQLSPLSIITPLGALASIFLIPVGYILLGELPSPLGALGVLLIIPGSFFLGWRAGEGQIRHGLQNVFREKGAYLALLGAFIASLAIALAKFTFRYAPPLLSAFYITLLLSMFLLPVALAQSHSALRLRLKHLLGLSVMSGSGISLHYVGLSLIPAVYYISVKRMSIVFNVFWGRLFFREDHTRERLIGAVLMVLGVILIALG